jgi:hypothetical protein
MALFWATPSCMTSRPHDFLWHLLENLLVERVSLFLYEVVMADWDAGIWEEAVVWFQDALFCGQIRPSRAGPSPFGRASLLMENERKPRAYIDLESVREWLGLRHSSC